MAIVIWITGLSGAGKTTLAESVARKIRKDGRNIIHLDGDILREILGSDANDTTSLARDGRLELAMRYSRLCHLLSKQGVDVVISTISMFKQVHQWNRANISDYIEVYLKVPLNHLRHRDPKGIYSAFDQGLVRNVPGLDLVVDEPVDPNIILEFKDGMTIQFCVDAVLSELNRIQNAD